MAALSAIAQDNKWDISRVDVSKLPPAADQQDLTFAKDIKPLFQASCMPCHGMNKPKHGLELDNLEGVLKGGDDGKMVVAGDSKKSLLVVAAAQIDNKTAMPPKRGPRPGGPGGGPPPGPGGPGPGRRGPPPKPLTAEQVGLVRAWIDQGAK